MDWNFNDDGAFGKWCICIISKNFRSWKIIVGDLMNNKKGFTIRIDKELYKKMVIKATLKDLSVNKYVTALIDADAGDVDLSGIIDE